MMTSSASSHNGVDPTNDDENENDTEDSHMCSVLNVVIDHSMEDPMPPLEPEDYQGRKEHPNSLLQVPVIRIFGPLLRDPSKGPLQSACLYVHGAFPYLLARPVVAGPDGSLKGLFAAHSMGQVNWDDLASVERIANDMGATLEATIRSMDMERRQHYQDKQNAGGGGDKATVAAVQEPPVIRKVTVVQGRGFFTYCPGPPAPFLKIEYYNPRSRWKVKLLLEKGLQVPLSFHPDPDQYDRSGVEEPPNEPANDNLRFHCYEAHIPYTMQFFKDWNLAGMSYLHVQNGRIRPSLSESCSPKYRSEPFDLEEDASAVFVKSNTPVRYLWKQKKKGGDTQDGYHSTPYDTDQYGFEPPKKVSSADIEIDCHVEDLRNVDTVLKSMPSDAEERDKIQWRAVPSLQEIWRQERRRMAKLLPPEQDFLTHDAESRTAAAVPFTLNVKQGSERSGARLAAKGMKSLVNLTGGLEENFVRALSQILRRHQRAVENVDQRLKKQAKSQPQSATKTPTSKSSAEYSQLLTPNWTDAVDALGSLAPTMDLQSPVNSSLEMAAFALESLRTKGQTLKSPAAAIGVGKSSRKPIDSPGDCPMEDEAAETSIQGSSPLPFPFSPGSQVSMPVPSQSERLSYPSSQEMHNEANELLTMVDPVSYSQRVDRGDSILNLAAAGRDVEDYIDPETLLPYEHLEFGDHFCRVKFRVENDPLGTIRICGNLLEECTRDGHSDDKDTKSTERAKSGFYKTVTTGTFVDGIVATSFAEHDDEEEDKDQFEKALTLMATQIPATQGIDAPTQPTQNISRAGIRRPGPGIEHLTETLSGSPYERSMETEPSVEPFDNASEDDQDAEMKVHGLPAEKVTCLLSSNIQPPTSYPAWITPGLQPPSRKTFLSPSSRLHVAEGRNEIPGWLRNATRYSARGERSTSASLFDVGDISEKYILPVRVPPTRRRLQCWCKRKKLDATTETAKRQKLASAKRDNLQAKPVTAALEIDGNSRQLVPNATCADTAPDASSTLHNQNVEEVQWHSSQHWQMSMSQQSPEKVDEKIRDTDDATGQTANTEMDKNASQSTRSTSIHSSSQRETSDSNTQSEQHDALDGIGAQGGRIHVQGGGTLKAKVRHSQAPGAKEKDTKNCKTSQEESVGFLPSPISLMSIEIHVQCRTGASRLDSKKISMAPDSSKDRIFAAVYVYGIDPGGGESLRVLERCCLFLHFEREKTDDKQLLIRTIKSSMPQSNLGAAAPLRVECLENEKRLLIRLSSLVRMRDPDMLVSWDTQGVGLGYIIERGSVLSSEVGSRGQGEETPTDKPIFDIVSLLGRTPSKDSSTGFASKSTTEKGGTLEGISTLGLDTSTGEEKKWKGSGLGSDWDDRVGAGAAAASIAGRLVFAGWKIVAEEVKHPNYSYLPAVTAAVLNKRLPHHDDLTLTQWYSSGTERWRVLHHRLNQATATLLLFDALDIVGRAGEAARLSGVEFSQSFPGIRGSQYKVEGVLLRALQSLRSDERGSKKGKKRTPTLQKGTSRTTFNVSTGLSDETKSLTQSPWKLRRGIRDEKDLEDRHYFFFSPSLDDTNKQEALEVQALTLEPQSGHYKDPVVVCDFTALYPSLVIAYNLCYSTCTGKLEYHSTRSEMLMEGKTRGQLGPFTYPERRTATVLHHHFKSLNTDSSTKDLDDMTQELDRAYIAPTGTIYVSEDVLKGVLPQVLDEILTTRAMLKRAAKEYKKNVENLSPAILRQLEARQLALKYVANVTYGYTSATFSGRCAMPVLADTIVECGRKTLTKAIDLANQWGRMKKWRGAKVVYGDTDSLFVKLPGRSCKEAFDFGEELCRAVTADNPPPVQLKLEKVYLGSIMQTMKRYCGMKFDSKSQKKPTFEAKGLETVRRDQCALTQKVLRNALITLFRDGIDGVKEYLQRQWLLIEAGQVPVSDFILTGGVRSKYRGGKEGPVQAVLAKRIGEADPGRIIRHKERLPYVIVATPGITFRLKDCVLTPLELLERWDAYTIHSAYYIERHVNASLQRCLGLAPHFIDINVWYQACPKPRRRIHFWPVRSRSRAMITTYFGSDICSLCHRKCQASGRDRVVVCTDCRMDRIRASQLAMKNINEVETISNELAKKCSRCNGCFEDAVSFAAVQEETASNQKIKISTSLSKSIPGEDLLKLPLANCVCIDCPQTFKRHRIREQLIEAKATCDVLGLL